MGILRRVKQFLDGGVPSPGIRSATVGQRANFVCAACQGTFEHQHHQCPNCGSRLLLPTEETEFEED